MLLHWGPRYEMAQQEEAGAPNECRRATTKLWRTCTQLASLYHQDAWCLYSFSLRDVTAALSAAPSGHFYNYLTGLSCYIMTSNDRYLSYTSVSGTGPLHLPITIISTCNLQKPLSGVFQSKFTLFQVFSVLLNYSPFSFLFSHSYIAVHLAKNSYNGIFLFHISWFTSPVGQLTAWFMKIRNQMKCFLLLILVSFIYFAG